MAQVCVIFIVLFCLFLLCINYALLFYIFIRMHVYSEKPGIVNLAPDEVEIPGKLLTSRIRSRRGKALSFESSDSVKIFTKTEESGENGLIIGKDFIRISTQDFNIHHPDGRLLFRVSNNEVFVGTKLLTSSHGFHGPVITSWINAAVGDDLSIQSATGRIYVYGGESINFKSNSGAIKLNSFGNLVLNASRGSLTIDASHIMLTNLPIVKTTSKGRNEQKTSAKAFPLCICGISGRAFLGHPFYGCVIDLEDCN